MIRVKLSAKDALVEIQRIEHATCQKSVSTNWSIDKDKLPQSICWLFCWAKTGMNSEKAREQSQLAFDAIFSPQFDWFCCRLDHSAAREWRYSKGNVEDDFYSCIGRE